MTVLFEAACFDGTNIRLSSKKSDCVQMLPVNLKRAWTRTMPQAAIDRACQLIEECGLPVKW
ncbi:MAG: hypothetical protein ACLVAT_12945 [Lachnospiraceae bacterium]